MTNPISTQSGRIGFWTILFKGATSHEQNEVYERTVRAGGEVMTVLMDGRDVDRIMTILGQFSPVDVSERAASFGLGSQTLAMPPLAGHMPAAVRTFEPTLQRSEERLAVGKRVVSRGATRLRRFV